MLGGLAARKDQTRLLGGDSRGSCLAIAVLGPAVGRDMWERLQSGGVRVRVRGKCDDPGQGRARADGSEAVRKRI